MHVIVAATPIGSSDFKVAYNMVGVLNGLEFGEKDSERIQAGCAGQRGPRQG